MLDTVIKILIVVAALVVNLMVMTLCWVGQFAVPLFLVSVVMNTAVGIIIGWEF